MSTVLSVNDAEKVTVVSVSQHSMLRQRIDDMLADTSLGENVVTTVRDGMFGGRPVVEYRPGPLPVEAWSTGEKALWLFLASVTSHQPVNLYGLAMQFAGTPEAGHILNITQTLILEGA